MPGGRLPMYLGKKTVRHVLIPNKVITHNSLCGLVLGSPTPPIDATPLTPIECMAAEGRLAIPSGRMLGPVYWISPFMLPGSRPRATAVLYAFNRTTASGKEMPGLAAIMSLSMAGLKPGVSSFFLSWRSVLLLRPRAPPS